MRRTIYCFTKPQRLIIEKPLPKLKKCEPVLFPRTKKSIYLSRIESNTIEEDPIGGNIIANVRNLFKLKKKAKQLKTE